MQAENFYPLNSSVFDPNVRGESPEGFVILRDIVVGAMVAGVKTVTVLNIPFGKDLGEVYGVTILDSAGAGANEVLAVSAVAGTNAGEVDITIQSSDAAAVDNLTRSFILFGRILPVNA